MPIVVPIRPETQAQMPQSIRPPDPNYLLMAAAAMHREGRLVKKEPTTDGPVQK